MSTIINNIPVQTISSPIVLGINTNNKKKLSVTSYSGYATTAKKWYRLSGEKLVSFDWDANQNELEFE